MQVLGSLLKIPADSDSLPLPWWHRAVLGLLHRTPVYVALLETTSRPVGDLIVTVLNPSNWDCMKVLEGEHSDAPGIIEKVFKAVYPLNIAIAETVTTETGDKHHICLFLEPGGKKSVREGTLRGNLESKGLQNFQITQYTTAPRHILWQTTSQVDHGWLHGIDWKRRIIKEYPDKLNLVDLNKVVVSADTEKRILRYVFPKKGAIFVKIEHADIPGALKVMSRCFVECQLNVLSACLTRGGAKPSGAILHAVCEPVNDLERVDIKSKLEERLNKLEPKYCVEAKVREGDDAAHMIYPRHPYEHVARVPNTIYFKVLECQKSIPRGKIPIFISRRFISGERLSEIVERIRKILVDNECFPLEGDPDTEPFLATAVQVSATMWVAKAGIVLVAKGEGDAISMNLVHEAGFLQGQGKEVGILVEEGLGQEMFKWSNNLGVVNLYFSNNESAFNPDSPNSLDQKLTKWIAHVKKNINGDYV